MAPIQRIDAAGGSQCFQGTTGDVCTAGEYADDYDRLGSGVFTNGIVFANGSKRCRLAVSDDTTNEFSVRFRKHYGKFILFLVSMFQPTFQVIA